MRLRSFAGSVGPCAGVGVNVGACSLPEDRCRDLHGGVRGGESRITRRMGDRFLDFLRREAVGQPDTDMIAEFFVRSLGDQDAHRDETPASTVELIVCPQSSEDKFSSQDLHATAHN